MASEDFPCISLTSEQILNFINRVHSLIKRNVFIMFICLSVHRGMGQIQGLGG